MFSYLIEIDALRVIVLVQAQGEAKRDSGNDGLLSPNPLEIVQVITAVKVTSFRITSPVVNESPWVQTGKE
jgi:hypothetical protein